MTGGLQVSVEEKLGLISNPVITGLWQVADLERDGEELDREQTAELLCGYINDGFTCIDMADHYGSAELISGSARARLRRENAAAANQVRLFTKWCPEPHECSYDAVRIGIERRLERLDMDCLDLLQLHWWSFEHPGYIDVMDHLTRLQQEGLIRHLGVTNFDTDHLHILLSCGFEIVSNQVCLSVLDRRALGDMSELYKAGNVGLLAYGSLAGGFLSQRWLGQEEPKDIQDWSKMKYSRFIRSVGGWSVFQRVLTTLSRIAARQGVSISNVAARWVLQQEAVAGVIVGARITEHEHRQSNRQLLSFELTDEDLYDIDKLSEHLAVIPGDCGTEYRRPPFLTASGDLSHHLDALPAVYNRIPVHGKSDYWRIDSGSSFEPICGYSRGVRHGNRILISGTTATHGEDRVIGETSLRAQTAYILDKISASISSLGGSLEDVVRTRIYLKNSQQWEEVSRVHGRYFGHVQPANTLVEVSNLVGAYEVEIEAEAVVDDR